MIRDLRGSSQALIFALADGKASEIKELSRMEIFKFYRFAESRRLSSKQKAIH